MTFPAAPISLPDFVPGFVDADTLDDKIGARFNALLTYLATITPVSGVATITPSADNTNTDLIVTTSLPFTPTAVQLTSSTGAVSTVTSNLWVSLISSSGFTVTINRSNTTPVTFMWTANP